MQIWVDADACPNVIKEILFRAASRKHIHLTLVANQYISHPPSKYIRAIQVPSGFDVADNKIVELASTGDIVITADIPLAAAVVARGAQALDPRGELYSKENIGQRLSMRNFMQELRSSGVQTAGAAPLDQRDRQAFANHLDRLLAQAKSKK
ncbi:MAG: YaiI/YqxD family protein [Pseudomonadales bacterium]